MSTNSLEVIRKPLGASNKKPLVLSSSRYTRIVKTVCAEEMRKHEAEEEQRYKDYLKQGSDNIVAKWNCTFKRTQEQKKEERQQKLKDKMDKEKMEFVKIREKDEQTRQDKIAKAQNLAQKLKPGPKELQSAAIQSETLKGRAVQRNITKEFEEAQKNRNTEDQFEMERQSMPWIEEEQKRISSQIRRNNQHKAELLIAINEKSRKKAEHKKNEMAENNNAKAVCDQEIKAQIEKEQEMLRRKREALRKNALEAMVMVEQRKAREQVQDTIEDKIITFYKNSKKNIEKIKQAREVQTRENFHQRNAISVAHVTSLLPHTREIEEQRFRKDISTIQLQFTAQEQEKMQRSRQQKRARIQEYFRELNAQKDAKLRKDEETRLALANRLKNEEVNAAFEQKLKDDKLKKIQEIRNDLDKQIEEHKQAEADQKAIAAQIKAISFAKEDKFFFDYAENLVADAVSKDRPLYPLVKAVQRYKKENGIDLERKLPPHLKSNLRVGVKEFAPRCEKDAEIIITPRGSVRKYGLDELKDLNPYCPGDQ